MVVVPHASWHRSCAGSSTVAGTSTGFLGVLHSQSTPPVPPPNPAASSTTAPFPRRRERASMPPTYRRTVLYRARCA